jgi:hypothetical protein
MALGPIRVSAAHYYIITQSRNYLAQLRTAPPCGSRPAEELVNHCDIDPSK